MRQLNGKLTFMNIPNILTLLRLMLIPVFVVVFYLPFKWAGMTSAAIFAFAGITDWLDGYLARKLNQTSEFGAFLDPVVDKLMVAIALVLLIRSPYLPYITVPVLIIIGREIAISALREWMAEIGKRTSVAVSYVGKVKTTVQILAVIGLLACSKGSMGVLMFYSSYILLYIAAVLTLWSMVMYLKAAWPNFNIQK